MKRRECSESQRIASISSPQGADREHLSSCERCREFLLVQQVLGSMATESQQVSRMPSADSLLVRSRILEKRRRFEEAARPLMAFQKVAYAVLVVCWVVFAAMQWSPLLSWLGGLELSPVTGIESKGSLPLSFFWMLAVLSVMTMMTMLHGLSTEEHAW